MQQELSGASEQQSSDLSVIVLQFLSVSQFLGDTVSKLLRNMSNAKSF